MQYISFVFFTTILFAGVAIEIVGAQISMSYYYRSDSSEIKEGESTFSIDNLKTVFVIHGWKTDDLQRPLEIKDELFNNRDDVGRVVLIDWSKESMSNQYGAVSMWTVPKVADYVGKEITRIVTNGMTAAENVEIVGHSLGAHIAGQAGRFVIKNGGAPIGLIIGLDPAGQGYQKGDLSYDKRLQKSDALKVIGIHTSTLGTSENISGEDIWVNKGKAMDDCLKEKIWMRSICAHSAAWDAFIDQLHGLPLFQEKHTSQETGSTTKSSSRKTSVNILILDVSPSMKEFGRIQSLVVASNRFVSGLPLGYHLGIVIFGGYGSVSSPIVNISSESTRKSLLAVLPTVSTSIYYTSIGAGLKTALGMSNALPNSTCPDFILITDGEENHRPLISEVGPLVKESCSKINSIAFGPQADYRLEQLSSNTNGRIFSVSDSFKDEASFDALTQTLLDSSDNQLDFEQRPIKLPSKKVRVDDPRPTTFTFDDTVGKNTRFALSSPNIETVEAIFTDPNGISYGKSNYDTNANNKEIVFRMDEVVAGNWVVMVKSANQNSTRRKRDTSAEVVTIFVTTNPRTEEEDPIRLDALLNSTVIEYPQRVRIEAGIMKGETGIAFAELNAHIKSSNGNVTILKLWDNGAGADAFKNDGVYSRYISQLDGADRYEVSVIATGGEKAAYMKNGNMEKMGAFERLVNVGSLKAVGNFVKPLPGTVTDLRIISINLNKMICAIMWTAAGDEADAGTAASFTIMATSNITGIGTNQNMYTFKETDAADGAELQPKEAGESQIVNLKIPYTLWQNAVREDDLVKIELYFIVQSSNEFQQLSAMSNIADTYTYYYSLPSVAATSVNIAIGMVWVPFIMQLYFFC